jgi:hypothetical protein
MAPLGSTFGQKRPKILIERHTEFLGRGRSRWIGVTHSHQCTVGAGADKFHMFSTYEAGTDDGQFDRLHNKFELETDQFSGFDGKLSKLAEQLAWVNLIRMRMRFLKGTETHHSLH